MKYKVKSPIMLHGVLIQDGEVELAKEQADRLLELEAIEEVKRSSRGSKDDKMIRKIRWWSRCPP